MLADLENAFNSNRLSLARRRRGLTRRALASVSGISERSLVLYEQGTRTPTTAFVEDLARALQFPVGFFTRSGPEPLDAAGVSFRAMTKMTASQRDRAIAGGELALELNEWLERNFSLPARAIPDLRQSDPETAANALRTQWALGDAPISNMVRLLEAKGVRVFSLAEDCVEVDAFSFWKGEQPFVFLNTAKSAERSRFDAAHELGHLVLHRHGAPGGREAERAADQFASAFLMPRTSILAYAPRMVTIPTLLRAKTHWKVALVALLHRLHDVGLVSDWHYRALCIEVQKRGFRRTEPEPLPREMSGVFEKVFASLRSAKRSKQDVARDLAVPVAELNALVFGLIVAAVDGGATRRADASTAPRQARSPLSLLS